MKLLTLGIDVAALSVLAGTVMQALPTIVTIGGGILVMVYYSIVIYDRIKYGPDTGGRHKLDKSSNS